MTNIEWLDTNEIAMELFDKFPEIDPQWISFPDLHSKICNLESFIGDPDRSNEKVLEAIQMLWIEESQ